MKSDQDIEDALHPKVLIDPNWVEEPQVSTRLAQFLEPFLDGNESFASNFTFRSQRLDLLVNNRYLLQLKAGKKWLVIDTRDQTNAFVPTLLDALLYIQQRS